MKKHFSKLTLAIILALVMGLAFVAPALADNGPPSPLAPELQFLGITKEIDAPVGTVIPASTFTFNFQQLMPTVVDGETVLVPRAGDPSATVPAPVTIPNQIITFPADVVGPNPNVAQLGGATPPNGLNLGAITWPHAGNFFFKISEVPNTNADIAAATNRTMYYCDNMYLLIVTVGNYDGGLAIFNIQIAELSAVYTPGEPPVRVPGQYVWCETAKQYNYRPGDYDDVEGEWNVVLSDIRFVNRYVHIIVPPNLTDPSLAFSKTVESYGAVDTANRELQFAFSATLVIPELARPAFLALSPSPVPVMATVTNAAGVPIPGRDPVNFGSDLANLTANFTLAHGEQLRFLALPSGTTFSVTEAAVAGYAPSATVTIGGVQTLTSPYGSRLAANVEQALTVSGYVSNARPDAATAPFNLAAFTNTHHVPEIMGLFVGSMPFMAALFGATVLLAMMVASRSRQRIEQLPIAY